MSSKPSNQAAWLTADRVTPLEVKEAPYPVPEPNEIVIHNHAVAINPVDFALQTVGSDGIQLGVAAGHEVVTTCSPYNFEYVKKLGARYAFDYSSPTVIPDIIEVFKGKVSAGAVAIGNFASPGNGTAAAEACLEIVSKSEGAKFVALEVSKKGVSAKKVVVSL